MRLHPREHATDMAELALAEVMYAELDKHDLTGGEWLRVVHGAYNRVMSGFVKGVIRDERHGDPDKPGGLE